MKAAHVVWWDREAGVVRVRAPTRVDGTVELELSRADARALALHLMAAVEGAAR